MDNGGILLVYGVLEQPPESFRRADIAAMQVLADFVVVGLVHSESCTIAALIDILMDILYGLHGCAHLDVNMGTILAGQVRVVGHDLAVIKVNGLTVITG